jgi:hypothetical protein
MMEGVVNCYCPKHGDGQCGKLPRFSCVTCGVAICGDCAWIDPRIPDEELIMEKYDEYPRYCVVHYRSMKVLA